MHARGWLVAAAALGIIEGLAAAQRDYPVKPVPLAALQFTHAFWLPRVETNRTVRIPFAFPEAQRDQTCKTSNGRRRGENFVDTAPICRTLSAAPGVHTITSLYQASCL